MGIKRKIQSLFNPDFYKNNAIWITSSYDLRKLIGIFGMSLPVILFISVYLDSSLCEPLESISHYYYTRASGIFVSILSILGLFLIIYKGKKPIDFVVSTIAGVSVLFVVFFPTDNITTMCCDTKRTYSVTILDQNEMRYLLHYICAGIFLACLSYMSLFLFSKSDKLAKERGIQKIIRNRIYKVCGLLMIVAMLIIFAGYTEIIDEQFYNSNKITFWMETLAVESFGVSWLIKGETMFQDIPASSRK